MDKNKNNFVCPMAWLATGISSTGYLRLCCNSDESAYIKEDNGKLINFLETGSISNYYNNQYLKKTRLQMMKGEIPQACIRCHQIEQSGLKSPRLGYLENYASEIYEMVAETNQDGSIEPKIRYVDFALGNKCNLKCRMCIPEVAYGIARDWDAINLGYNNEHVQLGKAAANSEVDDNFRNYFGELLKDVNEIQFTSGEPLISQHHDEILRLAREQKTSEKISLIYFTNLSTIPQSTLDAWINFKQVNVYVSLEGAGALNNYIRYPSKWDNVSANLVKLLKVSKVFPSIKVNINTVFQAYNVFGIDQLIEFLIPLSGLISPIPNFNYIGHPPFLHPSVLPIELRIKAKERIEKVLFENRIALKDFSYHENALRGHVEQMMSTDNTHRLPDFLSYTRNLDKIRNQDYASIFPEFAGLLNRST